MIKILVSDKVIDSIQISDIVVVECVDTGLLNIMKVKHCNCGCSLVEVATTQNVYPRYVTKDSRMLFSLDEIKEILKIKNYRIV